MKVAIVLAVLLLCGCVVTPRTPVQVEKTCFAKAPERLVRGRLVRSNELVVVPCS